MNFERTICLYDDYQENHVVTNAPAKVIKEAINYRDDKLINDEVLSSDFECIQEYIQSKGYTFEWVDEPEERYYW